MIKVIVVDDSLLIREIVSKILDADPDIHVAATAADPYEARQLIKEHNPDVITLDVEMPKMNGIEFLEKIMRLRPTPVVMLSTLTQKGAETTITALELGAVDCIGKPLQAGALEEMATLLCEKVKIAAKAQLRSLSGKHNVQKDSATLIPYGGNAAQKLIAIGASTGGVEAIGTVLRRMPKNAPPIVITQHMPELFTKSFADRLNRTCAITVQESQSGMVAKPGNAYIAHGGFHMRLRHQQQQWVIEHDSGPLISGHRPSVDVMFDAIVKAAPDAQLISAALLTGMGKDGANGLKALHDAGATTIAEDESSCVIFGMPRVAIELGAAKNILPLHQIASQLLLSLA
jgi:two-component system chemotaxis response regulator CheB